METLAVAGETVTDATGASVTVTVAFPALPSLVAVMFAEPAPTALMRPDVETVQTLVSLELQLITRPVSTLLFASRVTAESCTVPPTWTPAVAGDTVTDATGTGGGGGAALTVSAAAPFCPSLEAMMYAEPALTAVTTPPVVTEATPAFELDHETVRPVRSFPLASRRLAVALAVCPTTTEGALSDTETVATGAGGGAITIKVLSPRTPSLVALITAVPGDAAEIMPESVTLAI